MLKSECDQIIQWAEARGFDECKQEESRDYAYRCNGRIQTDLPAVADAIFNRLLPVLEAIKSPHSRRIQQTEARDSTVAVTKGRSVGFGNGSLNVAGQGSKNRKQHGINDCDGGDPSKPMPVGCSSNLRIYRYTEGQRFGKHIDEANFDHRLGGETRYTLLVYLSGEQATSGTTGGGGIQSSLPRQPSLIHDDSLLSDRAKSGDTGAKSCHPISELQPPSSAVSVNLAGGETAFYMGAYGGRVVAEVVPVTGRLLLHGHGAQCLTHEGRVVTAGVKYVLRTDVVYRS